MDFLTIKKIRVKPSSGYNSLILMHLYHLKEPLLEFHNGPFCSPTNQCMEHMSKTALASFKKALQASVNLKTESRRV